MTYSLNEFLIKNNIHIISGFAGIGKSTLAKSHPNNFIDLDSSQFSWKDYNQNLNKESAKGTFKKRNENFEHDYVSAIKKCIYENPDKIILISQHQTVRDELAKNNIRFSLAFPQIEDKTEFISRYQARGNNEKFISLLQKNWENWIGALYKDTQASAHIHLNSYLSEAQPSSIRMCINKTKLYNHMQNHNQNSKE